MQELSQGLILDIVRDSAYQILVLSVPLLGTAMIIGLIISILQATTSIQEQTLTFVPKIIALLILMIVLGPFSCNSMMDFTHRIFDLIATTRL
jgi:flagellar biosynthetic protein FliQ